MSQTDAIQAKPFRVIIVGAGIVGLSLSHALQLANINHVVLEKYDRVVSVKGAALIIWPNAERIFDQFGFMQEIVKNYPPITREYQRWPDGTVHSTTFMVKTVQELFGIAPVLLDRQACVEYLYNNLPDKSTIKLSKRVDHIEHTDTGIRVILTDGTVEEGDMVIGADGVHSTVRTQMWDYASKFEPSTIPESDKSALFSEYDAMFGVSKLKGKAEDCDVAAAETTVVFGQGITKLFFQQSGMQFWALIFKDKLHQPPKRWKATDDDMEEVAKRFSDCALNETVRFRDLWETRTRAGLLSVEEGVLSQWHAGRIVLVGDSAHKMTADLGLGANIAIEDAVALCNILHRGLNTDPNRHPTSSEINAMFDEYQKERLDRAKAFTDISGQATRMHSYNTLFGRVFATYIAPLMAKKQILQFAASFAKAPKLSYVPVRTIDENAEGWRLGKEEDKASSTLWLMGAAAGAVVAGLAVSHYGLPQL